jgi:hypothetical protein
VVAETNAELDRPIERFVLLFKEFDADDGELTRTGKMRREVVVGRYERLVEALYDGSDEAELEVTVTYQNGRESVERGVMTVVDSDEPVAGALLRAEAAVADAVAAETAAGGTVVAVRTATDATAERLRSAVAAVNDGLFTPIERFVVLEAGEDLAAAARQLAEGGAADELPLEGGRTATVRAPGERLQEVETDG